MTFEEYGEDLDGDGTVESHERGFSKNIGAGLFPISALGFDTSEITNEDGSSNSFDYEANPQIIGVSKYKGQSNIWTGIEFILGESDTEANPNFPMNVLRNYKIAFEYDIKGESPLSQAVWQVSPASLGVESDTDYKSMDLIIRISKFISPRISGISIYREGGATNNTSGEAYNLVKFIPLEKGAGWNEESSEIGDFYKYTITDDMTTNTNAGGTYGDYNDNISESVRSTTLNYGISTEVGDYLFVADINSHGVFSMDRRVIVRSKPEKYAVFDITNGGDVQQSIKSDITALSYYKGFLYCFCKDRIVRLNTNLDIQDDIFGFGCVSQDALVESEYWLFFADKNHVYLHDGVKPKVISNPIDTDNYSGFDKGWQELAANSKVKLEFLPKTNTLLALLTPVGNIQEPITYGFTYHILKERWDIINFAVEKEGLLAPQYLMNNIILQTSDKNKTYYIAGPTTGSVVNPATGVSRTPWKNHYSQIYFSVL